MAKQHVKQSLINLSTHHKWVGLNCNYRASILLPRITSFDESASLIEIKVVKHHTWISFESNQKPSCLVSIIIIHPHSCMMFNRHLHTFISWQILAVCGENIVPTQCTTSTLWSQQCEIDILWIKILNYVVI